MIKFRQTVCLFTKIFNSNNIQQQRALIGYLTINTRLSCNNNSLFQYNHNHYLSQTQTSRNYAKGKDKQKSKGKTKVVINESEMSEVVNVENIKFQMQKPIEVMKSEFSKHLSLRSTAGSVESIPVNFDGKDYTLQELAQIGRKNPKTLILNMAVFPQAIPAVLKAIDKSGMNLTTQQEGTTIYIPVPKVTREHRESLAKNAKALFVKCKDGIRDIQNKQTRSLKKNDSLSIDFARNVENQIVAMADSYITQAEKILESKQSELLGKE